MSKFLAELTALSCKEFSKHVASGQPVGFSFYWRIQFWMHWLICEFCRRYWQEIKGIGDLHKKNIFPEVQTRLPAIKQRLHQRLKDL